MSSRDTGGMATVAFTVGSWSKLSKSVTAAVGRLSVLALTCMGAPITVSCLRIIGGSLTSARAICPVRFVLRLTAMQTPTIAAGITIKQTQIPTETKTVVTTVEVYSKSVVLLYITKITNNKSQAGS